MASFVIHNIIILCSDKLTQQQQQQQRINEKKQHEDLSCDYPRHNGMLAERPWLY
jgi:hypothetical protein